MYSPRWVTMQPHCMEERDRSRENLLSGTFFNLFNCLLMVDLHWIDCLLMVDCSGLKEGGKDILVATDVAGRGTIQTSIRPRYHLPVVYVNQMLNLSLIVNCQVLT